MWPDGRSAHDADLGRLLDRADAAGKVIAALCHGPAGLLSAVRADGSFVFAGRRLTVFTNEEERLGGLGDNAPYLVEGVLRARGAIIAAGAPWTSTVVIDDRLITGQNPQSSADTAAQVIQVLAL